jgi:hypothetical protein
VKVMLDTHLKFDPRCNWGDRQSRRWSWQIELQYCTAKCLKKAKPWLWN